MGVAQVCVAILGARQHYAVAKLFHRAGMLGRFYTDLYLQGEEGPLPAESVISFPFFGLWYRWTARRARDPSFLRGLYGEAAISFAKQVVRFGFPDAQVLYSCNGPALELFQHAKAQGIRCILEQILIPQDEMRRLLQEEMERWPGWEPGLCFEKGRDLLGDREQLEWEWADLILGASPVVLEGILRHQIPQSKCRLVPYGVPLEVFSPKKTGTTEGSSKLRILFAGDVGLRKGVPYLLEALRALGTSCIEARFAGKVSLHPARLRPYRGCATFLGPIARHQMADLYHWTDLLVAPSICEGSSLVTYEALASGIPVIATPHAGAWVRDGVDGLVVPLRDSQTLASVLERFLRDREFLRSCSHEAASGRDQFGLDAYQERLIQAVQQVMNGSASP